MGHSNESVNLAAETRLAEIASVLHDASPTSFAVRLFAPRLVARVAAGRLLHLAATADRSSVSPRAVDRRKTVPAVPVLHTNLARAQ